MSRAEVSHGEPVRRGEPRRAEAGRDAEMSRGLALNSMTWSMWPTPSEVSIPSSFSACTTVRGNPSRMKPLPQSGVEMLSLMMPITCDWCGGRWAAGAKSRDACGGREQRGLAGARCTRLAQYTSDTRPMISADLGQVTANSRTISSETRPPFSITSLAAFPISVPARAQTSGVRRPPQRPARCVPRSAERRGAQRRRQRPCVAPLSRASHGWLSSTRVRGATSRTPNPSGPQRDPRRCVARAGAQRLRRVPKPQEGALRTSSDSGA